MWWQEDAFAQTSVSPAVVVRQALSSPDDRLNYTAAKLAFDRIVDPSLDSRATLAEVDRLAAHAGALAGVHATKAARLSALRQVIYEAGDWNGG